MTGDEPQAGMSPARAAQQSWPHFAGCSTGSVAVDNVRAPALRKERVGRASWTADV